MSMEARVRIAVSRRIWRDNPHSATIAAAAVGMAKLIDKGRTEPQLAQALHMTMGHLVDCRAKPDDLDEIRAMYCRRRLDLFSRERSDLH